MVVEEGGGDKVCRMNCVWLLECVGDWDGFGDELGG